MQDRNIISDDPSMEIPFLGPEERDELNRQTANNRYQIERANKCGCFHCGSTFTGNDVTEWIHEDDGKDTALCPYCGLDAVIVGSEKYPLSTALLTDLYIEFYAEEYERRKKIATYMPKFKGYSDYLRKGIPFLMQSATEVEMIGEINLFPMSVYDEKWADMCDNENLAEVIVAIECESVGGVVRVHCYFDKDDCLISEFIDEDGNKLPYEPWGGRDHSLLQEAFDKHGDTLRGIIKDSGFSQSMQLFVQSDQLYQTGEELASLI